MTRNRIRSGSRPDCIAPHVLLSNPLGAESNAFGTSSTLLRPGAGALRVMHSVRRRRAAHGGHHNEKADHGHAAYRANSAPTLAVSGAGVSACENKQSGRPGIHS